MSRILCTGACGLIGRHLVNHLLGLGHFVTAVDDLSNSEHVDQWNGDRMVLFVRLDVASAACAPVLTALAPYEVCFHLAAHPYETLSFFEPSRVLNSIVIGTSNVLSGCIGAGTVKTFVNVSSMARYGRGWCANGCSDEKVGQIVPHGPPFVEDDHEALADDPYGAAKVCAEQLVEMQCNLHQISWCHAVPHNVTGEANSKALSDPYRGVMLLWTNKLLRGDGPITIFGDGSHRRAPSYVGDIVPALVRMGFDDKVHGETINIGAERPYTILEISESVRRAFVGATGRPDPGVSHEPDRPGEVASAYCSVAKSVRLLGYEDRTPLDEMSRKIVEWAYRLAPNGVKPRYVSEFEITAKAPPAWLEKRM